jgi:hypothetical protein
MSCEEQSSPSAYAELLAEAAVLAGDGGLSPPTYGAHASGRERWASWSEGSGIEPWPPQPPFVAAWVRGRFGHDPVSTIRADLAALRRQAWATGAPDPTVLAKQVLANLVRAQGVVPRRLLRGSSPLLSVTALEAMAAVDCPLEVRLRHAALVLALALRWRSAWFRQLNARHVHIDLVRRVVTVVDPDGGETTLEPHPDPFHCPIRAAALLVSHHGDRLIPWFPSKLTPDQRRPDGSRMRKPSDPRWTPESIASAIDVLAEPIRAAQRNRTLLVIGYRTAWRPSETRRMPIASVRRVPEGWVVPAPGEAGRAGPTMLLRPGGGALDPVVALDAWFEAWPCRRGALFPGRLRPSAVVDTDPLGICQVSAAYVLTSMAAAAGVTAPEAASLRRSRGAHVWEATHDLRTLGRVMGYADLLSAWRFAQRLDPGAATEMLNNRRRNRNEPLAP